MPETEPHDTLVALTRRRIASHGREQAIRTLEQTFRQALEDQFPSASATDLSTVATGLTNEIVLELELV